MRAMAHEKKPSSAVQRHQRDMSALGASDYAVQAVHLVGHAACRGRFRARVATRRPYRASWVWKKHACRAFRCCISTSRDHVPVSREGGPTEPALTNVPLVDGTGGPPGGHLTFANKTRQSEGVPVIQWLRDHSGIRIHEGRTQHRIERASQTSSSQHLWHGAARFPVIQASTQSTDDPTGVPSTSINSNHHA